jgi:hypothetical protein
MTLNRRHSFWGSLSPLGGLAGASLLVLGSGRLSWGILVAGSLFWVYALSSLTCVFLSSATEKKLLPVKGRMAFYVCLSSFWGSLYLFMLWLLCPFAALEVFLLLLLVPLFYVGSGIVEQFSSVLEDSNFDISESVSDSVSKAGVMSGLMILISIVREPLSYCTLSFPGTYQGMITFMYLRESFFLPIRIFASSAGAFMLLGYIVYLYNYTKNFIFPGEDK